MAYKNKKNAVAYLKNNYIQTNLKINKEETDVIEWLNTKENKVQYIIGLIKEDMSKHKSG